MQHGDSWGMELSGVCQGDGTVRGRVQISAEEWGGHSWQGSNVVKSMRSNMGRHWGRVCTNEMPEACDIMYHVTCVMTSLGYKRLSQAFKLLVAENKTTNCPATSQVWSSNKAAGMSSPGIHSPKAQCWAQLKMTSVQCCLCHCGTLGRSPPLSETVHSTANREW